MKGSLRNVLAACLLLAPLSVLAIEMDIGCNRNEVYLGESFIITVNVHGTSDTTEPDVSELTNCVVSLVGRYPVTQMSFNNGSFERFEEISFSYDVKPLAAGNFRAGPIHVTHDGNRISATGPDIQVLGMESQTDVLLSIEASTPSVMVDDTFQLTFHLKLKRLPAPYAGIDPIHPDNPPHLSIPFLESQGQNELQSPTLQDFLNGRRVTQERAPGFAINRYVINNDPFGMGFPFGQSQPARFMFDKVEISTNDISYFDYSFVLNYAAKELGDITLGPVEFKGTLVTGVDPSGQALTKPVFAIGPAATVRVVPPPDEGRPPSFIGVMSTSLTASATLDAQTCQVGDPLTLTLTISDIPRPTQAYPPDLTAQSNLWQAFKLYPDTLSTATGAHHCTYTYTVRPTAPGTHEFPPVEISYFDKDNRSYRTVQTPAIPIQVIDNPEVDIAAIMSSQQRPGASTRSIDITSKVVAPLGTLEDTLQPSTVPGPRLAWLLLGTGPVVYGLVRCGLWVRSINPTRRKQRVRQQALRVARKQLRHACGHGTPPEQLPGQVCDIIRHYLADVTQTHTRGLMPVDLATLLREKNVPAEKAGALTGLYEELFLAGFQNSSTRTRQPDELHKLIDSALGAIDPYLQAGGLHEV